MKIPAFDTKELTVVREGANFFGSPLPIYSFPVSPKEAFKWALKRKPIWQLAGVETQLFVPKLLPDNVARALVVEAEPFDSVSGGGKDMFGIEWEYIEQVGGSMVRPGKPFLEDANQWHDKLVWPDIDAWDWEGSAKINEKYFSSTNYNICWFMTGWYERLISLMDFEGAIMAMVDEDQKDAVKALFDKLSDLYIRIFDKYLKIFPEIDGFCIHDDWGSQKETFFSPAVAAEMIVPYMRRVTDFIHSKGRFCEFHSCGQLLKQVPNMIDAGWDYWSPQDMNDTHKIYELYGDKILIGVHPGKEILDKATSEEQRRAAAREYADKFCKPEKPSFVNVYAAMSLPPAFREELYIRSRLNYSSGMSD